MSTAMKATGQHEFHPDAESLSAFAEHALQERERGQVLEHLAVCGRCRQVVALAREAADAEVEARAARQVVNQPNAWWKRWRFAWVPIAVAAALAVTSISVFVRQAEQHEAAIKIAERTAAPGIRPAAASFSSRAGGTCAVGAGSCCVRGKSSEVGTLWRGAGQARA